MNATIKTAIGDLLFWCKAKTQMEHVGNVNEVFTVEYAQEHLEKASSKLELAIDTYGGTAPHTAPNREVLSATWDLYQNGQITFDEQLRAHYSDIALLTLGELITSADLIRAPFERSHAFKAIFMEHQRSLAAQRQLSAVH